MPPGERTRDGEAGGEAMALTGAGASRHCCDLLPTKQDFPTLTLSRFSKHLPGSCLIRVAPPWNHGFGARFLSQSKISGHKAIVLTGSSKNGTFPLGVSLVSRSPFIESPMKTPTQCEPLTAALSSLRRKRPSDSCRYLSRLGSLPLFWHKPHLLGAVRSSAVLRVSPGRGRLR